MLIKMAAFNSFFGGICQDINQQFDDLMKIAVPLSCCGAPTAKIFLLYRAFSGIYPRSQRKILDGQSNIRDFFVGAIFQRMKIADFRIGTECLPQEYEYRLYICRRQSRRRWRSSFSCPPAFDRRTPDRPCSFRDSNPLQW